MVAHLRADRDAVAAAVASAGRLRDQAREKGDEDLVFEINEILVDMKVVELQMDGYPVISDHDFTVLDPN